MGTQKGRPAFREDLAQLRCALRRTSRGVQDGNPSIDVIGVNVKMSKTRHLKRLRHVKAKLEHRHDRHPAQTRRDVGRTVALKPLRPTERGIEGEMHDGVAGILQQD
jgi:hypothetical protein